MSIPIQRAAQGDRKTKSAVHKQVMKHDEFGTVPLRKAPVRTISQVRCAASLTEHCCE